MASKDHITSPRNLGHFPHPDGFGEAFIPCGDGMRVCLRVRHDRIAEAAFTTNGCGPVVACGSVITELVKGKTVTEAMALGEGDIMSRLDGLPGLEDHCAALAVSAMRQALVDHLALRREPWKKAYRQVTPFGPDR
jgi:nitrogen fixation NifU-like protein